MRNIRRAKNDVALLASILIAKYKRSHKIQVSAGGPDGGLQSPPNSATGEHVLGGPLGISGPLGLANNEENTMSGPLGLNTNHELVRFVAGIMPGGGLNPETRLALLTM
ncbi:hypothetical protein COT97_03405 [Candidatus Falkowbacteria bacterium CG10_big_fil_rev_8_21_14_0_10_39_11]|uniref:Uncharacterized protein n=1 Tax=Candidatus Falkowbacteria bacterium CG10_big_fil_rev_8_21_14_0_10_39_11 TaxID=1974565 RepID=A0A2H0V4L2_9BACT|nr:MAG: hypothetical protein COT97_03405 [Candidatus Falkowbacteria bacterium CG10_big_fil_rev_8_21_14_0_10_39_11]